MEKLKGKNRRYSYVAKKTPIIFLKKFNKNSYRDGAVNFN